jgi:5'-nucleotidase
MNLRSTVFLVVLAFLSTACSNGNNNNSNNATPAPPPSPLTILVTNDDGIGAPGIDSLVNQLIALDNVDVKVVAPAENQSGSSDMTTDGELSFQDSATISGFASVAVFGFPADAVNVAINELGIVPDLVVSGVNSGQNVGPLAALSGTVGAARTAARAGFPAVAASAGLGAGADFDAASALVIDWINANRSALEDNSASAERVISFNVPGCTAGSIRELVQVPLADAIPPGVNVFVTDCSIEPDGAPINDVDAMTKGFAAETEVPLVFVR